MKKQLLPEIPAGLDSLEIFRSGNYLAKAVYMGVVMNFSEMNLSIHSFRSYLERIRTKLDFNNRVQIAFWAHKHNI